MELAEVVVACSCRWGGGSTIGTISTGSSGGGSSHRRRRPVGHTIAVAGVTIATGSTVHVGLIGAAIARTDAARPIPALAAAIAGATAHVGSAAVTTATVCPSTVRRGARGVWVTIPGAACVLSPVVVSGRLSARRPVAVHLASRVATPATSTTS